MEQLQSLPDAVLNEPHVCIVANAISKSCGSVSFGEHAASQTQRPLELHDCTACPDNQALLARLQHADLDEILESFFADQCVSVQRGQLTPAATTRCSARNLAARKRRSLTRFPTASTATGSGKCGTAKQRWRRPQRLWERRKAHRGCVRRSISSTSDHGLFCSRTKYVAHLLARRSRCTDSRLPLDRLTICCMQLSGQTVDAEVYNGLKSSIELQFAAEELWPHWQRPRCDC